MSSSVQEVVSQWHYQWNIFNSVVISVPAGGPVPLGASVFSGTVSDYKIQVPVPAHADLKVEYWNITCVVFSWNE